MSSMDTPNSSDDSAAAQGRGFDGSDSYDPYAPDPDRDKAPDLQTTAVRIRKEHAPKLTHLLSKVGGVWWIAREQAEAELDALLAENERLRREVDSQTARKAEWFDEAARRGQRLSEALDELEALRGC